MRQTGIVAAAGLYALENNVARLAEDHENAQMLTEGLGDIEDLNVQQNEAQTNMTFFALEEDKAEQLALILKERGILITPGKTTRMVTHLDITSEDVLLVLDEIHHFFEK